jgi:amidohydrolase family protein
VPAGALASSLHLATPHLARGATPVSLLVIRAVRVFDGVSDRAIELASVIVEGARIREVVVGTGRPPRDARVIEGRGGTLLPGFIDMHSHLVSELGARLYLANGVTTVRFAGNDPDAVLGLREAIESGRVPGPRVFSLGPLLDGVSPDYPAMSWPLYSATEARLAVQRLKADYRVDGIILTQKPALEVARAAVDEAHRLGIGVTGQTWSLTAREAVALGYDGLENTSRLPEAPGALPEAALLRYRTIPERSAMLGLLWARADTGRLERLGHQMLKYETYLVPTLSGMDGMLGRYTPRIHRDGDTRRLPASAREDLRAWLGQRFFGAAWTPRDFANWARGRARYHRFIRDYARLGGRVLVGTDALKLCAGFLFHEELDRLRACGLSNAAVLRGATAAAADTLGRPDLGRIAPGAQADLVLVDGDPLRRLADARAVRAVVVRGRLLERDTVLPRPRARAG